MKPQGRNGEVAVELLTDFPERFEQRRNLRALLPGGGQRELHLLSFWEHKGRLIMGFENVASIDEAQTLVGAELQIPASERVELERGSAYISDLIGCVVVALHPGERYEEIGRISNVMFGAGAAPLLVVQQEREGRQRELLVPFAEEYVRKFDAGAKRIEMQLPEGMLDLDAPLSAEEKDDQHRKH